MHRHHISSIIATESNNGFTVIENKLTAVAGSSFNDHNMAMYLAPTNVTSDYSNG